MKKKKLPGKVRQMPQKIKKSVNAHTGEVKDGQGLRTVKLKKVKKASGIKSPSQKRLGKVPRARTGLGPATNATIGVKKLKGLTVGKMPSKPRGKKKKK